MVLLQRAIETGIEIGPDPVTGCNLRQLLDHNAEDLQRAAFDFQSQCWVNVIPTSRCSAHVAVAFCPTLRRICWGSNNRRGLIESLSLVICYVGCSPLRGTIQCMPARSVQECSRTCLCDYFFSVLLLPTAAACWEALSKGVSISGVCACCRNTRLLLEFAHRFTRWTK